MGLLSLQEWEQAASITRSPKLRYNIGARAELQEELAVAASSAAPVSDDSLSIPRIKPKAKLKRYHCSLAIDVYRDGIINQTAEINGISRNDALALLIDRAVAKK